ncbi:kinase-like protein [Colletotrichum tofieldiae]|uniref:Kinase-like protein n=1 Tax=Colletotrichum tofieldiae TaxID=708197 RepID=A0A166MD98_9PEZI|nr:kinase-like protein [Colletotrichum tofieldiae]
MYLKLLAGCTPLTRFVYRRGIRMVSTITGESGRVYVRGEVLQRHCEDHNLSVFKAKSGNQSFVVKRVPKAFYRLSMRLADEFAGSRRLRIHIDCNNEEGILVYPYYGSTLLSLIQEDQDFPVLERKKILRATGEAIQELHSKDWMHSDVKPDNILVNWTYDNHGLKLVTDVALGDFDIAHKSEAGQPRQTPYAIGNAMWRSPEGQTGTVTKASDIFSLGLVCIYALGGGDLLLINDYQELTKRGTTAEQEILTRHFSYFGSVSEGLLKQVNSVNWRRALEAASAVAEQEVKEQPGLRFIHWGEELGPEAQDMIVGMTNPDPTARTTIDQVLTHRWWRENT